MDSLSEIAGYTNFSMLDWVIVGAYLLGAVAIGFYVRRYIANMTDYVVAGRSVRTYLGLATMIGTEMGLVTVMYSAQKGFTGGFAAFHIAVVAAAVTLLVGLLGMLTAGMLAAFMSTHDSYLLCWSSVLTQDVLGPLLGQRFTTRRRLLAARGLIFLIGVFLLVWGLWYPLGQDLWDYMAVTGAVYFTGAFAVLLGGLYWKRASRTGAYAALVCGFAAVVGLKPVQRLFGLDWPSEYVGLSVVALACVAMAGGSLLLPDRRSSGARLCSSGSVSGR